jgi:hypothetical protein
MSDHIQLMLLSVLVAFWGYDHMVLTQRFNNIEAKLAEKSPDLIESWGDT